MSTSLYVKGFTGKDNPEFIKHFNAVKFCIENELSFPKETSEFFKGKVHGDDLESYHYGPLVEYIENGIAVELKFCEDSNYKKIINVKDIPKECEQIIIEII